MSHAFDASVVPRVTSHTLFLQNLTHGFLVLYHNIKFIIIHVCQILLSRD